MNNLAHAIIQSVVPPHGLVPPAGHCQVPTFIAFWAWEILPIPTLSLSKGSLPPGVLLFQTKMDLRCSDSHKILCAGRLYLPSLFQSTGEKCLKEQFSECDSSPPPPQPETWASPRNFLKMWIPWSCPGPVASQPGHVMMDEASSWLLGKLKGNHWPNALSWERLWDSIWGQQEMTSGSFRNRGRRHGKGEVTICSVEVDESYSVSSADICYHVLLWLSGQNTFERVSFSYYLFSN